MNNVSQRKERERERERMVLCIYIKPMKQPCFLVCFLVGNEAIMFELENENFSWHSKVSNLMDPP